MQALPLWMSFALSRGLLEGLFSTKGICALHPKYFADKATGQASPNFCDGVQVLYIRKMQVTSISQA